MQVYYRWIFIFYFQLCSKILLTVNDITISEPHYLLFYSADCKYTAAIRERLEMPRFSIVTKIFTTQRLTRGKSVLRLFDIPGGIHCKLENYGFHKQNFDYFRF